MTSCGPCARSFESPSALRQHLRSSAAHPVCAHCDAGFMTEAGYLSHCKSKHEPECASCHQPFETWQEVEEHWLTSEAHPRCERCKLGFQEYRFYVKHMNGQHVTVACPICYGLLVPSEDLDKHYLESSRHPTCLLCHIGFLDDPAYTDHARTSHATTFCRACSRYFDSLELLQEHFARSGRHPACTQCGSAFFDEKAAEDHAPACPQAARPLSEKDSVEVTPTKYTPILRAIRMRGHHSTPSEADLTDMATNFLTPSPSPARPRPESGFPPYSTTNGLSPPTSAGVARWASEMSELDLGAIPAIAVQEPSAAPSANGDAADMGVDVDDLNDSEDGDITAYVDRSPLPPNRRPNAPAPRLLLPQSMRLRLGAPSLGGSGSLQSFPSVRGLRLLDGDNTTGSSTPTMDDGLTPRSPVPPAVPGAPFGAREGDFDADAWATESADEPAPRQSLVYCRVCGRDPCALPTATMCGHVFCKECIEEAVMRTSRCPVCSQAVLLYCLFRLHLDN